MQAPAAGGVKSPAESDDKALGPGPAAGALTAAGGADTTTPSAPPGVEDEDT